MSRVEMKQEIELIKRKLLNTELGTIERSNLLIALICLYESALEAK